MMPLPTADSRFSVGTAPNSSHRRRGRGWGLLIGLVPVVASAQVKYLDADTLGQAAGLVFTDSVMRETMRVECGKDFSAYAAHFDTAYFEWRRANEDELSAADKARATLSPDDRVVLENAARAGAKAMLVKLRADGNLETYCVNQVQSMRSGETATAKRTPKASAFLKQYLVSHPLTNDEVMHRDFISGCEAQSLNKGVSLDTARPRCACLAEVQETKLTAAERAESDQHARARMPTAELMQLPHMQRILPDMARCMVEE